MFGPIVLVMQGGTSMENQVGPRKSETQEVVVTLLRGHKIGGEVMRRAPVLSIPKTRDALGIMSALNLKHSGIDLMCEANDDGG